MNALNRLPRDAEDVLEPHAGEAATKDMPRPAGPPFDWQVLLLRYLPQPVGSTHVIKRLAPR